MIEGQSINLGGAERVIPPLNFKALRTLKPELDRFAAGSVGADGKFGDDDIDAIVKVAHAALIRNYPDVTLEEVEDWIDFGNMGAVITAVMAQTGMQKTDAADGGAAANPPSPSTGTPPTAS